MEQWERDSINQRITRVEEEGRETRERLRKFEWRDGERAHLSVMVLFWILLGIIWSFEIAMIVARG